MKWKHSAFGVKLWAWFALFAAAILAVLWLLQTVFLQNFYDHMAIENVQKTAKEIVLHQQDTELSALLDRLAYENALLLFLTDREGNLIYSTDEHSGVYGGDGARQSSGGNPYHNQETLGWQAGASRHLSLPQDFDAFLKKLDESGGTVGYRLEGGDTYVYGQYLSTAEGEAVLYVSAALEAVGATVSILRLQLLWVTAASLLLALGLAALISLRFSKPVAAISRKARAMAAGDFSGGFEKGFCAELDSLADTLDDTAAELSRAENVRQEFLTNVSHDLRTPLTMIRGYAEMVRDISWQDDEQRESDLNIIMRESDRLTGLVNDILEYTALQSGGQRTVFEAVDLSAAAEEVLSRFLPLCRKEGYCLERQIQPGLTVRGSGQQLSRVLYNLIDNALRHAGEKRTVQVVLREKGETVRAEVRDFGPGIPKEELPRVWERYFTSKQRGAKGSGLGLAISKEILTAHHARFGVDSGRGMGSLFWFELPVHRKE